MQAFSKQSEEWLNRFFTSAGEDSVGQAFAFQGYVGFGNIAHYRPGFTRPAFEQAPQITFDGPQANEHEEEEQSLFLYGSAEEELIEGGSGFDWVFYTDSDAGIIADLSTFAPASGGFAEGDIFISIENIVGSSFADTLIGNGLGNIIRGEGGDDILLGGAGADAIDGGAGLDLASYENSQSGVSVYLSISRGYGGDAEGDSLSAVEQLQGSDFDDRLMGDFTDNMLFGMEGDDVLNGRAGNDVLSGAGGADTFLFNSGFGQDVIEDFELGVDLMVFSDATSMDALIFTQDGDDTIIRLAGSDDTVRLVGISAELLNEDQFLFFSFNPSLAFRGGAFDQDPAADIGDIAFDSIFVFI